MLNVPTQFPHPGSTAWLRSADGQEPTPCRIVQHRADASATVAIDERFKAASSTRTVRLADLFATRAEALPRAPPPPEGRVMEDPRTAQAIFDTEAAHLKVRALRALARRDPVLAQMIADDLRWMPLVLASSLSLALAVAVLLP